MILNNGTCHKNVVFRSSNKKPINYSFQLFYRNTTIHKSINYQKCMRSRMTDYRQPNLDWQISLWLTNLAMRVSISNEVLCVWHTATEFNWACLIELLSQVFNVIMSWNFIQPQHLKLGSQEEAEWGVQLDQTALGLHCMYYS